jgi:hypothetical protein
MLGFSYRKGKESRRPFWSLSFSPELNILVAINTGEASYLLISLHIKYSRGPQARGPRRGTGKAELRHSQSLGFITLSFRPQQSHLLTLYLQHSGSSLQLLFTVSKHTWHGFSDPCLSRENGTSKIACTQAN